MDLAPKTRLALRAFALASGLAMGAFVLHAGIGLGGRRLDRLFNSGVYDGLMLAASCACLLRAALVPAERLAWAAMGTGILLWTGGELYWSFALSGLDTVPVPSSADAFYLSFYPFSYVALVLLVRARVASFSRSQWLDGGIAATAVAALVAALVLQPIADGSTGSTAAVATNLAYPVGDLTLLALVIAVVGLSGWRPGRAWALLGAGLACMALADVVYLLQSANGSYVEGTILDALWPAAALLVGLAAWVRPQPAPDIGLEGRRVVFVPAAAALVAIGLTLWEGIASLNGPAALLSSATLLLVTIRMVLAFIENQRMLASSRQEALTDALTGLGNRRRLLLDLDLSLEQATPLDPRAAALFDLNGFKSYNDTFGHPAGDALLARLGKRLMSAAAPYGRAYRMGGDEFCILFRPGGTGAKAVVAGAAAALSETGRGFAIDACYGVVELPVEAGSVPEALQVADRRMYSQKGRGRASASRQTRDVLMTTLHERQPDLHAHLRGVAELALAVARRLGMSPEELDEVARAAELHDVGKIAIPDAILDKPAPLEDDEWDLVRRHTVIGERILAAAPALVPVAKLVRSSHERWDGKGYPDGLAGEQIPLGARIVAVCDAYDAMTSSRSYRGASERAGALAELRQCAGSQFDPRVVDAFCAVVGKDASPAAGAGRAVHRASGPLTPDAPRVEHGKG